jgi:hypothetical protein
MLTIDLAHPPLPPDAVEAELLRIWSEVRNSATVRLVKIIHGHGSSGKGGTTKETVRNWLYRHRAKFRLVVDGERYTLSDPGTQKMRRELGQYADADLNSGNPGVTVVWVK